MTIKKALVNLPKRVLPRKKKDRNRNNQWYFKTKNLKTRQMLFNKNLTNCLIHSCITEIIEILVNFIR
jgi:hypothetical protein